MEPGQARQSRGLRTDRARRALGPAPFDEVIHEDDLALTFRTAAPGPGARGAGGAEAHPGPMKSILIMSIRVVQTTPV